MFDLQNMVSRIKKIPGYNNTDAEFLSYTFDFVIKERKLKRNGNFLSFSETRVSKVLNYAEILYVSICNITKEKNGKDLIIESVVKSFDLIFDTVSAEELFIELFDLIDKDEGFDKIVKKDVYALYQVNEFKKAYAELIYYVVLIERARLESAKTLDKNHRALNKKIDKSIIADIVSKLAVKNTVDNSIKHKKTWSIDDKIKRNKLNYTLNLKIKDAYEDYENVMAVVDVLCINNVLTKKYLFAHYKNTYLDVLGQVLENDITDENILNMSSVIFERVNTSIYNEIFNGRTVKIEYEVIQYNLFALTVAVFYQCKFLISMEE